MATLAPPLSDSPPTVAPEGLLRLSVEQYHAMIEAGILVSGDPVELLGGFLVEKMPKSPQHSASTRSIREGVRRILPVGWIVDSQEPLTTLDSEPEPDVLVFRGQPEDYENRHPGPSEIGLVVEVSESSLSRDRGIKRRIYAGAGIPYYWLANLRAKRLEVLSLPSQGDYTSLQKLVPGQTVPLVLDGVTVGTIAVDSMLK